MNTIATISNRLSDSFAIGFARARAVFGITVTKVVDAGNAVVANVKRAWFRTTAFFNRLRLVCAVRIHRINRTVREFAKHVTFMGFVNCMIGNAVEIVETIGEVAGLFHKSFSDAANTVVAEISDYCRGVVEYVTDGARSVTNRISCFFGGYKKPLYAALGVAVIGLVLTTFVSSVTAAVGINLVSVMYAIIVSLPVIYFVGMLLEAEGAGVQLAGRMMRTYSYGIAASVGYVALGLFFTLCALVAPNAVADRGIVDGEVIRSEQI